MPRGLTASTALGLAAVLLLAGCSSLRNIKPEAPEVNPTDMPEGPGLFSGESGNILEGFKSARGNAETGGNIGVNIYLWRAALESRSRTLNPKFYEGLLKHGAEGVRLIESHVSNTFGWSATTGKVEPWVYQRLTETFVTDEAMRRRLAALNPEASSRMAQRLLEASDRAYWTPDPATLAALQQAADELEDRLEGIAAE